MLAGIATRRWPHRLRGPRDRPPHAHRLLAPAAHQQPVPPRRPPPALLRLRRRRRRRLRELPVVGLRRVRDARPVEPLRRRHAPVDARLARLVAALRRRGHRLVEARVPVLLVEPHDGVGREPAASQPLEARRRRTRAASAACFLNRLPAEEEHRRGRGVGRGGGGGRRRRRLSSREALDLEQVGACVACAVVDHVDVAALRPRVRTPGENDMSSSVQSHEMIGALSARRVFMGRSENLQRVPGRILIGLTISTLITTNRRHSRIFELDSGIYAKNGKSKTTCVSTVISTSSGTDSMTSALICE